MRKRGEKDTGRTGLGLGSSKKVKTNYLDPHEEAIMEDEDVEDLISYVTY